MLLNIYSLRRPVFRREAKSVNVKTVAGEITILDNHRPLIAPLAGREIRIVDAKDKEEQIESAGGFVEVRPNAQSRGEVNILVD